MFTGEPTVVRNLVASRFLVMPRLLSESSVTKMLRCRRVPEVKTFGHLRTQEELSI
jgi:hypothetical protein